MPRSNHAGAVTLADSNAATARLTLFKEWWRACGSTTGAILPLYQNIPESSMNDVKVAMGTPQLIADATLSTLNNSKLRRAVSKAMQTLQKESTVNRQRVADQIDKVVIPESSYCWRYQASALQKQHRRRRSPSPIPSSTPTQDPPSSAPEILAIFRVNLQSLAQFSTATSPAHFPAIAPSHYWQVILIEDPRATPMAMLKALRIQFQNSAFGPVMLDWGRMVNPSWWLRTTAIGKEIAELHIHAPKVLPG